ncbi:type IV secretion system protein [Acidiphilium sp.]|uniref:type IV secretion system protein n=1 Tax=Acidiphilium sp. TaxID=527 RepID=UPI003D073C8C
MILIIGGEMLMGRTTPGAVLNRFVRIGFVVALIANSSLYYHYVQDFFMTGIPDFITKHVIDVYTAGASSSSLAATTQASPGAGFDDVLNQIIKNALIASKSAPTGLQGIVPSFEVGLVELISILALGFLFAVFVTVQTILGITVVIGPIMILGYIFEYTKRITDAWISALVTLAIMTLVVDVVVLILLGAINAIFSNMALVKGDFSQNIEALLGGAAGIVVIGLAVAVVPRVIEGIGGGVAVGLGLENAHRWLRGGPVVERPLNAAGRGAQFLGRQAGSAGLRAGGRGARALYRRVAARFRNRNGGDT